MMKIIGLLLVLSVSIFARVNDTIEALPNVLFTYDKLKKEQTITTLQVDFNKAVAHLEKEQYEEAIKIFKQTATILKIPSFLNIGIAYYKLADYHNAQVYLKQIYNVQESMYTDTYAYMSAAFYLYKINNEQKYLESITQIAKKKKNLSETSKRMLADTFIILKEYEKALKVLDSLQISYDLKKALLYIKLKDYKKAEALLERAYKDELDEKRIDQILWFMIYRDLKDNNLTKLQDHLTILDERKLRFFVNQEMPLKIAFNEYKYLNSEYMKFVTDYSLNRQADMVFYFAPFIFSDNEEIIYDSSKGFIFNSKQNLESLENMVRYNAKFINIIKEDPIVRAQKLKHLIHNRDQKSYVYYNLALSYAQIHDFVNAHKLFTKAYKLNPGNKLYAVMTLISAQRINTVVKDKEYIVNSINSNRGLYNYFGKELYRLFINPKFKVKDHPGTYKKTILYNAIQLLSKLHEKKPITEYEPLFVLNAKDPLVYLMKLVIRKEDENKYAYISRLQDTIPLNINNNFLDGSLIITEFYVDILKGLALFGKANFTIDNYYSPSYLRTKSIGLIHDDNAQAAISVLEYLQKKYELQDRFTLYLIVAAYLQKGDYENASLQLSYIKALLNDTGANFLSGVQLIQELKLSSAKQMFNHPYYDTLIDFDIEGLDQFLEGL